MILGSESTKHDDHRRKTKAKKITLDRDELFFLLCLAVDKKPFVELIISCVFPTLWEGVIRLENSRWCGVCDRALKNRQREYGKK